MERDAFTGGVEPGGLWSKSDIRILLCYILSSVNGPLDRESLSGIIQGKGLANYFETGDALDALVRQGSVTETPEGFTVTAAGREIAANLDATLPLSVRDKALEAALRLQAETRARRENSVEIVEDGRDCRVICHVSGGGGDLMAVSLAVPDRAQARLVERNFYRDPEGVYKLLLAALTGDVSYARSFLENRGETS